MRMADVYMFDRLAGRLSEREPRGDIFEYDETYRKSDLALPISHLMPVQDEPYVGETLFPFFDGLIPEGWLLDIAEETWKLNPRDRFGLLLACCRSSIGAVSVREVTDGDE